MPVGLHDTGQIEQGIRPAVAPIKGALPERLVQRQWGQQGYFSTTHDLLSWYRALRAARVISKKAVGEIFDPVVKIKEGFAGLGWFFGTTRDGEPMIFDRGNEDFGANALIYAYPHTDAIIIVLTHAGNRDDDQSWSRAVHAEIERLLFP